MNTQLYNFGRVRVFCVCSSYFAIYWAADSCRRYLGANTYVCTGGFYRKVDFRPQVAVAWIRLPQNSRGARHRGPGVRQTHTILTFVVGSCGLDSVLLTEGRILVDPESNFAVIDSGPPVVDTRFGGSPTCIKIGMI